MGNSTDDETPEASNSGATGEPSQGDTVAERPPSRPRQRPRAFEPSVGTTIDRFVVVRTLGEGGMGKVVLAYDPELDRKVALKFLRPAPVAGLDASDAQLRLLREAQAIARLTDPNVVAVYEVGKHEDRVFVALEYVEGSTMREWLVKRSRGPREIVAAYVQAARGLAAAHRAGLVHRDFKPDNILVGDDGRIRVTDFGLARLADEGDEAAPETGAALRPTPTAFDTPLTEHGAVVGTPGYIAPETYQGQRADERSDQFAFCAALYRALYGVRPFDGKSAEEISQRVLAGELTAPARAGTPSWLRAIVVRGLSADPEARYPSMDAVIAALEHDPTMTQRRAIMAIVAIGGLAGFAVWAKSGGGQADLCTGAERKLAGIWDLPAQLDVQRSFLATGLPYAPAAYVGARRVIDGYTRSWADMHVDACKATRVRGEQSEDLLARRMVCLDGRLGELAALVRLFAKPDAKTIEKAASAAGALSSLDSCADAQGLLAQTPYPQAADLRAMVDAVRARFAEADALRIAGNYAASTAKLKVIVVDAAALGFAPLHAQALYALGSSQLADGKLTESVPTLREAGLTAEAAHLDEITAEASGHLSFALVRLGHPEDARNEHRHAMAVVGRMGNNERLQAQMLVNSAVLLGEEGKHDEQAASLEKALSIRRRVLGEDHADTALTYYNLALVTETLGHYKPALEHIGHALAIQEKLYGRDHPAVAKSRGVEGAIYQDLGQEDKAEATYRAALDSLLRSVGRDHPDTAGAYLNLGNTQLDRQRYDDALASYKLSVEINERVFGADSPLVANGLVNVGQAYVGLDKIVDALAAVERALRIQEKAKGPDHPSLVNTLAMLGQIRQRQQELDEATVSLQRGVAIGEKAFGKDHPQLIPLVGMLSEIYTSRGQFDAAIDALRRVRGLIEKSAGAEHPEIATTLEGEVAIQAKRGAHADARRLAERALALREKAQGAQHPALSRALEPLARSHIALGKPELAIPLLERSIALREAAKAHPGLVAWARFHHARALWDVGRERARALRMATDAKVPIAAADDQEKLAEINAWLKTHR